MHAGGSDLRLKDGSGVKLSVKLAGAWWSVLGRADWVSTVSLLLLQCFRVGLLLSNRLVSSQWILNMFAVLICWWVKVLHADRTTSMCMWTTTEHKVRLLLLWFILIVNFHLLSVCLDLLFNLFRIALWPSVGKELFPWLFICAVFI